MTSTQEESKHTRKDNIFSQPWNDSDIVLVVEDQEFHVHRFILSVQSPVFKAMLNGNFKDATQDRIELKDEEYEAMSQFLQLLYPANMLRDYAKIIIDDKNILQILEIADKYGAMNIIKQCMDETERLKNPENAMRLLPYAVRHELPRGAIFDVMNRHVSTKNLTNFAPEQSNGSVYIEMLKTKSQFMENYATRASSMMEKLADVAMTKSKSNAGTQKVKTCPEHTTSYGLGRRKRGCKDCIKAYKSVIEEYVFPIYMSSTKDLFELLKISDDIAASLES